jgi:hypothetical protein
VAGTPVVVEQVQRLGVDQRGDGLLDRLADEALHALGIPAACQLQQQDTGSLHPSGACPQKPQDQLAVGAFEDHRGRDEPLVVQRSAEGKGRGLGDHRLVEIEEGGLPRRAARRRGNCRRYLGFRHGAQGSATV